MNMPSYINQVDHNYSQKHQNIEMVLLSFLGFLTSFTIGHPQILVGVLVNALLIRSAFSLPFNRAIPILFTPSLGVLARGLVFGPLTMFLVYLIPFIWVGNLLLVSLIKFGIFKKINNLISLSIASLIKAGFLFSSAFLLVKIGLIPEPLIVAMGGIQLITAMLGGLVVLSLIKLENLF